MASIDAVWPSRKIAKFKKTVTTAKVAGILNMATDGTKEKANASKTIIEQHALYGANCSECPFQAECAVKGKRRKITSDDYEAERRRMTDKMQSEEGREESKKRKEMVELPFGNIKHNLKVMWGKSGRSVAASCNIKVANFASKVTILLVFFSHYLSVCDELLIYVDLLTLSLCTIEFYD